MNNSNYITQSYNNNNCNLFTAPKVELDNYENVSNKPLVPSLETYLCLSL